MILKSSFSLCQHSNQTHSQTHSHKQSFLLVSTYCFCWSTVKTVNHKKRRKTKRKRSETRDTLQEGSGSQLRVSITVSHHSDWWLTVFATLQRIAKETNIKAQHVLDPRRDTFPFSSWLFIFYLVKPVLHYYQHFSYFTLIKWHLLVVVVVVLRWCISAPYVWWYYIYIYCMMRSIRHCWRWDPAPSWRWAGLLHLLWEADWMGWGGEGWR